MLTPEGSVFDDEVEMVSTRTEVGSIGILARHEPLLGMLVPTELRLYQSSPTSSRYAQGEGYVQVGQDGVLVLVEEAHKPGELDAADLREKLRKAEDAHAARRRRAPRSSAAPAATSAAGRRSCASPRATRSQEGP